MRTFRQKFADNGRWGRVMDLVNKALGTCKRRKRLDRKESARHRIQAGCTIGEGTKVWQFASVIREASIGSDCSIGSCAIVDGARVGNGCLIGHGASIHPGSILGDRVFVGPGAVLCNDNWPRTHKRGFNLALPSVVIEDDASIGANATVPAGVTIGKRRDDRRRRGRDARCSAALYLYGEWRG